MVSEITVRLATAADTALLSRFATRTFREAFAHTAPPDAMAQYLQDSFHEARVASELADPATIFLIAVDDAYAFVGYCKLYLGGGMDEEFCPSAPISGDAERRTVLPVKLWRLYTAREWQGRGVGALLLEHAVAAARQHGGSSLWLTVNTENSGAVRFYARNDFAKTGFTTFNLGGEIHRDFVMERELGDSSR